MAWNRALAQLYAILVAVYLALFKIYRFRYTHEGLADLLIFKNGVGVHQNEVLCNMDLSDENSYAVDYLYKQMCQNFPNAQKSISQKR